MNVLIVVLMSTLATSGLGQASNLQEKVRALSSVRRPYGIERIGEHVKETPMLVRFLGPKRSNCIRGRQVT